MQNETRERTQLRRVRMEVQTLRRHWVRQSCVPQPSIRPQQRNVLAVQRHECLREVTFCCFAAADAEVYRRLLED